MILVKDEEMNYLYTKDDDSVQTLYLFPYLKKNSCYLPTKETIENMSRAITRAYLLRPDICKVVEDKTPSYYDLKIFYDFLFYNQGFKFGLVDLEGNITVVQFIDGIYDYAHFTLEEFVDYNIY